MAPTVGHVAPNPRTTTLEELRAGLRLPDEQGGGTIFRSIETHASLLFFTRDRVYKVKKPVVFDFLDFGTPERRRFFCEEEVRLNARLAPDVYLGIVPITREEDGSLRIRGHGAPVEWAVEMVRLPRKGMLAAELDRGVVDNATLERLARTLCDFHARAASGPDVAEHGSPEAVCDLVTGNLDELAAFAGDTSVRGTAVLTERLLAFLRERAVAFLADEHDLLQRRWREGRIREGHGDLHADNVCRWHGGFVIYDALEFSKRLRCADVACDLAFLAMDLDSRGYRGFSGMFVRLCAKRSGDGELHRLMGFYKTHRALVRCKVAALGAADGTRSPETRHRLRLEAMRYAHLAASYHLPPVATFTIGLPGSGKSTRAAELTRPFGGAVLSSDLLRKRRAGLAAFARAGGAPDAGLYAPEEKDEVYRVLARRAAALLGRGREVVVDATFARRRWREAFVDAMAREGFPAFGVWLRPPEDVIRTRLEARERERRRASDADWSIYLQAKETFEPPTELGATRLVTTDGIEPTEHVVAALIERRLAALG